MFGKKQMSNVKSSTTTYIGKGMKIEGKIRCVGPIRIDGEVYGDIDCRSEITIGPTAFIEATIHAAKVVVNGKIEGNLFTSDQLEIMSEGHIKGNVTNPPGQLIIHEGAVIEGQCFTHETKTVTSQSKLEAPTTGAKKGKTPPKQINALDTVVN